jgi:hypothetical protein
VRKGPEPPVPSTKDFGWLISRNARRLSFDVVNFPFFYIYGYRGIEACRGDLESLERQLSAPILLGEHMHRCLGLRTAGYGFVQSGTRYKYRNILEGVLEVQVKMETSMELVEQ